MNLASPPRVEEIFDLPDPADAAERLLGLPYPLLLESADRGPRLGRHSFLAADPYLVLRSRGGRLRVEPGGAAVIAGAADPFAALQRLLAVEPAETVPGLPPFQGGAAGYFGYDLCHHLERLPSPPIDDVPVPDLCVGFYDRVIAWDHEQSRCWLISTGRPAAGAAREQRAADRAAALREALRRAPRSASPGRATPTCAAAAYPLAGVPGVASTTTRDAYIAAAARVVEYIHAGDVFQANLSHRLQARLPDTAWAFYRRLRARNAAPFAAFFDIGDAEIASASPERFLRVAADRVETRPIKGTAPRGASAEEDRALRDALGSSEKDRAENVMIVDLLRNDLSRVCLDEGIEVPELCTVETFARVHHLVSEVVGRLRPGIGPVDVLRAAFPGGSITGAPKVRAMEIIAELEPTRRGVYTGAIGYVGFDGSMDTNIAIRTATIREGTAYFAVGGGIVADSVPEREWEETLHKARGIFDALEP
jgi:para-aminobenzoate synthetase component I